MNEQLASQGGFPTFPIQGGKPHRRSVSRLIIWPIMRLSGVANTTLCLFFWALFLCKNESILILGGSTFQAYFRLFGPTSHMATPFFESPKLEDAHFRRVLDFLDQLLHVSDGQNKTMLRNHPFTRIQPFNNLWLQKTVSVAPPRKIRSKTKYRNINIISHFNRQTTQSFIGMLSLEIIINVLVNCNISCEQ